MSDQTNSNLTNYSGNGPDYTYYAAAAATLAAPLVQPFVDALAQAGTGGVDALQRAYQNYQSGRGAQTTLTQAGLAQTQLAASVTAPPSYMPSQPVGMPVTAVANAAGSASSNAGFQPNAQASNGWLPAPHAHEINVRAALNEAMPVFTFSDLMAMTSERLAQLTPLEQEAVNSAIMRSSPGFPACDGPKLAELYFQYSLGPDNEFSHEASNLFMDRFDGSFQRYSKDPLSESNYRTIRPQLSDLGDHAQRTTQQLKSQFNPLNPGFLRASMFQGYKDAFSSVGQPGSFDYENVAPSSIYNHAQTLKQVDEIYRGYHTMKADILGTDRLYQNNLHCPNGGLIGFKHVAALEQFAPGGVEGKLPAWRWFNPSTWFTTVPYFKYPSGVEAYFVDGKVVGVLPGQYTLDGKTWIPRTTNDAIQKAQEDVMTRLIVEQKEFFNPAKGRYSNCRYGDIPAIRKVSPGQVPGI